ncbi:MAG: nucleotidyl transferase AbiEii/AbiGii toxin family protein [Myxococcaceae bacterium]|nr:nucleotidyl transferase AbiEii/AbiGii toxin family protein [Myxococcaceae bacterium]
MPSLGRLTDRQLALARAFFRHQPTGYFLTGGAVLAGWELAHRGTDDLDLFTIEPDAMVPGEQALRRAAAELGGTVTPVTTSPDFRRFVVHFSDEALKVDLVRDYTVQQFEKVERDGVVTDTAAEIFVNKLCTLVERSEIRDLVDVMLLERRGLRVEDSLSRAQQKDAGVTPATMAWLLDSLPIPANPPGGVSHAEVVDYRAALRDRLLRVARQG